MLKGPFYLHLNPLLICNGKVCMEGKVKVISKLKLCALEIWEDLFDN
jgi:hypothetical protein